MNSDEKTHLAFERAELMKPFLIGLPPEVQGAILAELLGLWLAGHRADVREQALDAHLSVVRELIPINARVIWAGREH